MMELTPTDHALLNGEHGQAAARAMAMLVRYGNASGAHSFVSVESAHIDGCLYHGPSSIDFVKRFVSLGGRVRVPTTLNVAAVDVTHPDWHCGPADLIDAQRQLKIPIVLWGDSWATLAQDQRLHIDADERHARIRFL